jgi:hypothetical protein
MRIRSLLGIAAGALLALPGGAFAQTIQERLSDLEKKVEEQGRGVAGALGVDVHGLVAGDYLYNFNDPDSHTNQVRVFDEDANSFTLNQANLWVGRQKEDESVGFATSLDFGKTAEVVGRATRWSGGSGSGESSDSFELREAYLTYKAPIGDGVTFKAGKFVTLHGAEIIKNYNGFNYTVSNSILFGYSIPFTHTGVMASFPLGEYVGVDLGVVNGWDTVVDNNDGKSIHTGIKITPNDMVSLYLSGTYGPEQSDDGNSKRLMLTTLLTVTPTDQLTFILDHNYATENDVSEPASGMWDDGERDVDWHGVAAYAIFKLDDQWSFSLRGEYFADPDGVRTLADEDGPGVGPGPGVGIWEITPSVSYQITEGLTARAEYRHDEGDREIYEKHDHVRNGQDTVAAELIYAF